MGGLVADDISTLYLGLRCAGCWACPPPGITFRVAALNRSVAYRVHGGSSLLHPRSPSPHMYRREWAAVASAAYRHTPLPEQMLCHAVESVSETCWSSGVSRRGSGRQKPPCEC